MRSALISTNSALLSWINIHLTNLSPRTWTLSSRRSFISSARDLRKNQIYRLSWLIFFSLGEWISRSKMIRRISLSISLQSAITSSLSFCSSDLTVMRLTPITTQLSQRRFNTMLLRHWNCTLKSLSRTLNNPSSRSLMDSTINCSTPPSYSSSLTNARISPYSSQSWRLVEKLMKSMDFEETHFTTRYIITLWR